jgi:hypothetical protein
MFILHPTSSNKNAGSSRHFFFLVVLSPQSVIFATAGGTLRNPSIRFTQYSLNGE